MWELDYKENWASKNWCFSTVVLEKTLESPLDCKGVKPVHPKKKSVLNIHWKDWCWSWNSILWPPDAKNWLTGKDPGAGKDWRRRRGRQRIRWHHQLNGHEFGWALGVGDGQGGLVCCSPWGFKELDMTEQLNWTELNWTLCYQVIFLNLLGFIFLIFVSLVLLTILFWRLDEAHTAISTVLSN